MKFDFIDEYSDLFLNQLRAGKESKGAIIECLRKNKKCDSYFSYFKKMTDAEIGRRSCLPTAAATAINVLSGKKTIGDDCEKIKISDFYRIMLPCHTEKPTGLPIPCDQGWLVLNKKTGAIFYQSLMAFSEIFQIKSLAIFGFSGLKKFEKILNEQKSAILVSVDNKFCLLKSLPKNKIKKTGGKIAISFQKNKWTEYRQGRHGILVLKIKGEKALIFDPLQILEKNQKPKAFWIDIKQIDKYLNFPDKKPKQALIFSKKPIIWPKKFIRKTFFTEKIKKTIKQERKKIRKNQRLTNK